MKNDAIIASLVLLALFCSGHRPVWGQYIQTPNAGPGFAPVAPPSATLGQGLQDPYGWPAGPAGAAPGVAAPGGSFPPPFPTGPGPGSWGGAPNSPPPGAFNGPPAAGFAPQLPPLSTDPYGQPTVPGGLPPSTPPPPRAASPYPPSPFAGPQAPQSGWGPDWQDRFGPQQPPPPAGSDRFAEGFPLRRLFEDTGLRATYIYGKDEDDMSLTEAEASTTAYFPNFWGVEDGLRVTPGFIFHWTDGPGPPETTDVPGRLYSAYLDVGLNPQFSPTFGAELSARVGVFTDFQEFSSESLRLMGTGVAVWQSTPTVALKLGGAFLDRVKVKFLPAGGVLWTPNPQTRWDVFFPAPKLSNYWTTWGNQQIWWYVGGEYGGGSWTIERETGPTDDRMDINDIRLTLGIEWWDANRYYGFAEVGYVFDREVAFYRVPSDTISLDDSFMVRGGISW